MSSDILLRFASALGIIFLGVGGYWLLNKRLLVRVRKNVNHCSIPCQTSRRLFISPRRIVLHVKLSSGLLEKLTKLLGEKLHIVEIDATERPDLAKTWGVMSVPTTFLLDLRGEARYVNNGVTRAEKLMEQIQTL